MSEESREMKESWLHGVMQWPGWPWALLKLLFQLLMKWSNDFCLWNVMMMSFEANLHFEDLLIECKVFCVAKFS